MAAKKSAKKANEDVPFESLVEKLEGIVGKLEAGELPLEESLASYEQGIALVRQAQARLDAMDQRLEQLTADGRIVPLVDDGTGAEAPADGELPLS